MLVCGQVECGGNRGSRAAQEDNSGKESGEEEQCELTEGRDRMNPGDEASLVGFLPTC